MKITRRTLITLLIELLIVLLIVYAVNMWRTRDTASGPAPPLQGIALTGEQVSLAALQGDVALVYFWASWCPICRLEQGTIASLARSTPTITVALSSGSDEEVRQHLDEQGLAFVTINDEFGAISQRWGVAGVPMIFIIDASGDVRFREMGYTSGAGLRLRLWLTRYF
jgi:peroxiredoxin